MVGKRASDINVVDDLSLISEKKNMFNLPAKKTTQNTQKKTVFFPKMYIILFSDILK